MPPSSLARRFRYHAWATLTLAEALPERAVLAARPLAHAVMADRGWRLRIADESPAKTDFWPLWMPDQVLTEARLEADAYTALLADLSAEALSRDVAYTTTEGESFETPTGDILDHVLIHGSHHRGQACAAIRASGQAPPWVDFMAWVRLGEPTP